MGALHADRVGPEIDQRRRLWESPAVESMTMANASNRPAADFRHRPLLNATSQLAPSRVSEPRYRSELAQTLGRAELRKFGKQDPTTGDRQRMAHCVHVRHPYLSLRHASLVSANALRPSQRHRSRTSRALPRTRTARLSTASRASRSPVQISVSASTVNSTTKVGSGPGSLRHRSAMPRRPATSGARRRAHR